MVCSCGVVELSEALELRCQSCLGVVRLAEPCLAGVGPVRVVRDSARLEYMADKGNVSATTTTLEDIL